MEEKKERIKTKFRDQLIKYIGIFNNVVSTKEGDWSIKGFIDIVKNIYTISIDTKVISKILEIMLFPKICQFTKEYNYKIVFCKEQNFYPDITFIDNNNNKIAVDLKTTYLKNNNEVNGMTLGAFTGYFRDRKIKKNITFPYNEYIGHFVLGIVYSRIKQNFMEGEIYKLNELHKITSVIKNFTFFIQEKYRIATDRPGSGNTKNIGSITDFNRLIDGKGPFSELGEEVFDDYWMYYLTKDMALAVDLKKPSYKNLKEYKDYKRLQ